MTSLSVRALLPPAIIVAATAWVAQGCGRTSLLVPGAQDSAATDAAGRPTTPTDGAASQPTNNGTCPDGFTACGRSAATRCYDLTRSPEHCGECGNACAPGIACESAQCQQYRCKGALAFKALPALTASTLPSEDWSAELACSYVPVLGDFDRDGILDFVGQTGPRAPMGLLLGSGDGTFQPQPLAPAYASAWAAAAADLNGDGWLDLAIVTGGIPAGVVQSVGPVPGEAAVSVRLGNGDAVTRFDPATTYPAQSVPTGLLLADVDDDGHADLVAATEKRLTLWRGTATGVLGEPTDTSVGATGSFLVAADWNRDGVLDLLFGASTLRMLIGRGDGTFDKEIACGLALVTNSAGNVIADFDHDQKLDMVVSSTGVLLGMNGCNFTTLVWLPEWGDTPAYGHGTSYDSAAAADLDGDGNADIVTSFFPTGNTNIGVWPGDGRGGFAAPIILPSTESFYEGNYLIGDLNNDAKLDIIVTWPDGWQVLLNTCP